MSDDVPPIHRAVFGDLNGSHGLVAASPGVPDAVLTELASRYTDRLLPTEVPWEPYGCGFQLGSYYVLTRTFPVQASRTGMVQTHTLLLPQNECADQPNLHSMLRFLPQQPDPTLTPASSISAIPFIVPAAADRPLVMPAGYPSVVRLLVQGRTPVWLGQRGFEELVVFLWYQLWPDARRQLRFRVSAEPSDLDEWPATLVCTPTSLRVHWDGRYLVDQAATQLPDPSMSEAYLLGLTEGHSLRAVRERLELPLSSIAALEQLEQYVTMLERDTADSIRLAVRLLGRIAPAPEQAALEKASVLARLAYKTTSGTDDDVLGLRNLETSAFATAAGVLRRALAEWTRARIDAGTGGVRVVSETFLARNSWEQYAQVAIHDAFNAWDRRCALLLWHWWQERPALVQPTTVLLTCATGQDVESDFIATAPSFISSELRGPLLVLARNRQWCHLHGTILAASSDLTTLEKFRYQLQADTDPERWSGIKAIAERAGKRELLAAALALQDARLLRLSGRAAVADPTLMTELDASKPAWRSIWHYRLGAGGELFEGVAQPAVAAHAVMDAVLAESALPPELLERLAVHPNSDLVAYERRKELWRAMPAAVVAQAVMATAKAWLARFLADAAFDPPPLESQLQNAVLVEWRSQPAMAPPEAVPRLWARFSDLSERDLLSWLEASKASVEVMPAIAIGRLVLERDWSQAGTKLLRLTREGRNDLTFAVQECASVLGFWDRLQLALFGQNLAITEDDWWRGWLELCADLYPKGVDDQNIWNDAAGDISRVRGESGREQWSNALHLLRRGGAGERITIEGLLHEMREDFQGNPGLRLLEEVYLRHFSRR